MGENDIIAKTDSAEEFWLFGYGYVVFAIHGFAAATEAHQALAL